MKLALAALAALLLLTCSATAVVIVSGTASDFVDTTGLSGSFTYDLQGGGNALVIGGYIDNVFTATNFQFDGNAATGSIQEGRTFLAYYYNPDSSVNITFDLTNPGSTGSTNGGYFLYELSYVDTAAAADMTTGASITTTSADRFVVDYSGINFSDGAAATPAAGSIVSGFNITSFNGDIGGGALASGVAYAGAAGLQTLGWANAAFQGETSVAFASAAGSPTPWNVNGGGSYNQDGNWVGGATPGDNPFFGNAHSTATTANITVDSPVSLSGITISNPNTYNITGPSTLTLTGNAEVLVGEGDHEISAVIAGSAGLNKTGGGSLLLSASNSYTGATNVQGGALQLANASSVNGAVNLAAAGQLSFVPGFDGAFAGDISGSGAVVLEEALTTETVTFSNAKTYTGATQITGGTLVVSDAGSLGTGAGTAASGTTVSVNGGQGNGKLALSNNVTVANELLTLFPRRGEGVADLPHLTSAGNNTWGGNIKGDVNGDNYNFETTSGTLTLSGVLSAPDNDTGIRNFVFDTAAGATIDVTGKIIDQPTNADGVPTTLNLENNVNVIKRGAGTLKISTATDNNADFWFGSSDVDPGTVIEAGTLQVVGASNNGELRTDVHVSAGATYNVTSGFSKYNLIPIDPYETGLSGAGTVVANTLGIWESNTISPGESVGTLKVNGNVDLFYFDANEDTVRNVGSLNFELGDDASVKTVDNAENDLISVSGSLTIGQGSTGAGSFTSEQFVVNAIIADGVFDTDTNYTLIDADTLTLNGGVSASNFQVNFTDTLGNVITGSRYTAAIVLDTVLDEVQLNVDGTPASQTWTGTVSTAWDINTSQNWTGVDNVFRNLDEVTFDDSADENDTVDISNGDVFAAAVNFDSATGNTYTVTGANSIGGATPINLTGDVVVSLQNTNDLQGNVSIAAGAELHLGGGSTASGDIVGSGSLVIDNGGATLANAISLNGPITINSQVFAQNSGSFGTSNFGTTINTGGNVWFNFVDLNVGESFTFNGGLLNVSGSDASALTLTGTLDVAAGGGAIQVNPNMGDDALLVSGNITGSASGSLTVSVSPGSLMSVTGNITNNGALIKTGAGTLVIGASTSITSDIAVNGGTLDTTAQSAVTLNSGQTLSGSFGTLDGNVTAPSGSVVQVGVDGLELGTVYQYTDATWGAGGNTTLPDGTEYTPPGGSSWLERGFGNGGTILESQVASANPNGSPVLKTTVGGLTPGETYNVMVHYWSDTSNWRILAGESATLSQVDDYYDATTGVDLAPILFSSSVVKTEGNRTLYGALLSLTANGSGEIEAYFDDAEGSLNARTWYDGVSVELVTVAPEAFSISGDLALQAGSTLSLDLASPGNGDLLTIEGALSVADGFVLDLAIAAGLDSTAFVAGDSWDLIDFGSASGSFSQGDFLLPTLSSGLAWDTSQLLVDGTISVTVSAGLAGDFNEDGIVDAADYAVYRNNFGQNVTLPNDDGIGGVIGAAHYDLWRSHFGNSLASVASSPSAAPEPASLVMLGLVAMGISVRRRSHKG